ncbi:MAG: 50S ribosomal protein L23 [Chloroflexi bacterium RBG_13_56_8b]|jgi:large subunit ribosomal protein L23|nr:MAG: 50S ribosomal protein L23 [Chloroflexi bacterium RBG_13_56_8b]
MHLSEVLRRPLVTEKNTAIQAPQGKYAFEVAAGANKNQVKLAVEKAFKVNVAQVNVLTVPGRRRMMRGRTVTTPSWKKAIVTLKPGDKIELFEGV